MPQYDWFAPNTAPELTQAGLARINQSIEAFVYSAPWACILGTQVSVRSSILDQVGRAKEAQSEFLVLMEAAIRQPEPAQSVQRYQLAVHQAKVRLNLAVSSGAWLMPARMIIGHQKSTRPTATLPTRFIKQRRQPKKASPSKPRRRQRQRQPRPWSVETTNRRSIKSTKRQSL